MASDIDYQSADLDLDWRDLEGILAEIATLSKSDLSFDDFAQELLSRCVRLLAAFGGSIWQVRPNGRPQLVCQIGNTADWNIDDGVRRRTFGDVTTSGSVQVVAPATVNGELGSSDHGVLLFVGALKVDCDVVGFVEIVQRPNLDVDVARGNHRFVSLACELASDYLHRRELRKLRQGRAESGQLDAFARRVHATVDLRQVAYELVNEGRQYLGCDRVSVAIRQGRRFRLIAMSGIGTVEHRSNAVRRLERLVTVVGKAREPFWYDGNDVDFPPQIAEPLHLYLDEANVRAIGLVPLTIASQEQASASTATIAVLVAEHFTALFDESIHERTDAVAEHGKLALTNALRYQSIPTLPFLRRRRFSGNKPWLGVRGAFVTVALMGAVAAMALVPAEFSVYAEGKLQPAERQEVFAPLDGQVVELAVRHADGVEAGDKLLELSSPQLDIELQQAQGEYETARKRLLAVESALLQSNVSKDRGDDRIAQLSAEQEELIKLLEGQQEKLRLLQTEVRKLVVRSPIAGQVVTWDLEPLLRNRPVQRGQALMSVANLNGPWIAEIEVPDDRAGYVLDAQAAAREPLGVSFRLSTERGAEYRGAVREVAARTSVNDTGRPVVNVTIAFDESRVAELRPGATVYARVLCGQRALGYVWLHDLIEAARRWLLF